MNTAAKKTQYQLPQSTEIAIIGAGLAGLTCALELQRHGLEVCIFEKRHIAGGYAHNFKRKSYEFDVSLHHLGGLGKNDMTYNILQPLGVLDKLDYRKKENLFSTRFPDFTLDVPNETDAIIDLLSSQFPKEKDNLQNLFDTLRLLKHHVTAPVLHNDFKVAPEDLLSFKYIDSSFDDLVSEHISDYKLKAVLSQLWNYLGLPPEMATANYSACIFASGFIEGAYHIKGGGTSLTKALTERFEELGGKIFYRNGVKKIIVENKVVKGIELEKGEYIATKHVVSNASPHDTFFNMMNEDDVSKIFRARISQMEISNSLHAMYVALDCIPSEIGVPANNFFYNHQYDFTQAYKDCMAGKTSKTDWCSTNPELAEDSIAPKGCGIVSFAEVTSPGTWLTASEENYQNAKNRLKDILLDKYDSAFPGLKKHAVDIILGTPRTMKRYSSNPLGAVYGFAQTIQQSNNRRLGNRAPINGLALTGSWTQAGGGYEGTMMTGLKSAHVVLQEMNIPWLTLGEYNIPVPQHNEENIITQLQEKQYPMYELPLLVYPEDTNYKGNVTETAYLRFYDRGRVSLVEQSDELRAMKSELDKYFVHVYRMVMDVEGFDAVGKELSLHTGYRKTSSHRASVDQLILDENKNILSKALFEIVFVKKGGELVELPDVYKTYSDLPFEVSKPALPKAIFKKDGECDYKSEYYIYYEDTDAQSIIYNVSYVKFCQKTFYNFKDAILKGQPFDSIATKRVEVRFLNSAGLGDTILVKACYRPVDSNNFVIDYLVENKATNLRLSEVSIEYKINAR